ncbi:hypothetical protein DFH08DRAFT_808559 [Mycena albidolilacea]|uniref:Uncharacterized protein n=1 Tax=Mycena albidolilacea TaxID=1033008 RepID=A0AAD7A1P8_9AGAR|nr:hypothetical protein DFH08DRAFT_808559 [Mycena albidolilacea]
MAAQRYVCALRLSSAILDQLTPAPPIQLIILTVQKKSYFEGRELCRGGVHMKGGGLPVLRGGMHRKQIWVCLGRAQFFSGGPGADTRVHTGCTCAQRRTCAKWRDSTDN